jgi:hypothetical protein
MCAVTILGAACSPREVADSVTRRAAETVVQPVLDDYMTGPQAQAATACVLDNASVGELQALARDVGVVAGTSTVANVLAIAARPAARQCLDTAGVPPLPNA